jgi:hypothetical protein
MKASDPSILRTSTLGRLLGITALGALALASIVGPTSAEAADRGR